MTRYVVSCNKSGIFAEKVIENDFIFAPQNKDS